MIPSALSSQAPRLFVSQFRPHISLFDLAALDIVDIITMYFAHITTLFVAALAALAGVDGKGAQCLVVAPVPRS